MKTLFPLSALFLSSLTFGQNLIQNPGFESGSIPTAEDQVNLATGWTRDCGRTWSESVGFSNPGSPDLFDTRTSNCLIDAPVNKWNSNLPERTNQNRYVGIRGGVTVAGDGTVGPFYGETVRGNISQALTISSCAYTISLWASRPQGSTSTPCGTVITTNTTSQFNQIQAVLRKDNDCNNGLVVWTSNLVISSNWTFFSGQFNLTPTQAAIGYNRIEFRMVPRTPNTFGMHGAHIDDVSLTIAPASQPLNPDFTLTGNSIAGNSTNYLVTASVSSVPAESSFFWEICEVNPVTNVPLAGTCMVNPSNWWHPSLQLVNTFPGYCCNTLPIAGNGVFVLGRKYRVTRGVWWPCHSWQSMTKFVFMSTTGIVTVDDEKSVQTKDMFQTDFELMVYPSPATTEITISWNGPEIERAEIWAADGKFMQTVNPATLLQPLPIESFSNGMYVMYIQHRQGASSSRFIVSR